MSQQTTEQQAHDDDLIQLVTFHIGDEEFGVDILAVQEIIRLMQITMVPRAPAFIEGVINLRGKVIPVVNMRTRFNKPVVEHNASTRIVVMEFDQKTVGFLVDAVSEVLRIPASTVEEAPVVCSVENRSWAISAAVMAVPMVSWSRISPSKMTSGASRIALRSASA